ncbi:hypothetical protein NLJ89_g11852 [Agrocybe chaxingu]|uniref:Uncharacterized protein n=1 Tax=Agrocybe chaxingu TaxID=84603 RepID=A0A9W8JMZ4_9AGAR|nr:hypothetical protein NLJ89_g11852 [Agrocybe chaxingu]
MRGMTLGLSLVTQVTESRQAGYGRLGQCVPSHRFAQGTFADFAVDPSKPEGAFLAHQLPPTISDDSALSTQPRAQLDYLPYDWQEEPGNTSRRTWWKQRNKLKTAEGSDITWLYGSLHTPVEWTPPPKPQSVPDTVDTDLASAHQGQKKKRISFNTVVEQCIAIEKQKNASGFFDAVDGYEEDQEGCSPRRGSSVRRS